MTEESAADRQAAQQAREQEKKYADSATAVSADVERADPTQATDGASFSGESSEGTSTVFDEADDADTVPNGDSPTSGDDDADPPTLGYGERPDTVSGESEASDKP